MNFFVHHIHTPELTPWVQYILFNYCNKREFKGAVSSLANTNYCLGITKDKRMEKDQQGNLFFTDKPGIHSYLTGIYLEPYNFHASGEQDEICIDFTPSGFFHFFRFRPKTFLLNDDVLAENFGNKSKEYFEKVFKENDFSKRGQLIERFLLSYLRRDEHPFLNECLWWIHGKNECYTVGELAKKIKCSERKIHRHFTEYLDISPKEYMRVVKFRKTLKHVSQKKKYLTGISHDCDYYDQSHMIREFRFFTGHSPQRLSQRLKILDGQVVILTG